MVSLFRPKKSYLGVDIGSHGVKLVELTSDGGRPKLVTYGYTETKVSILRNSNKAEEQRVASLIKKIMTEAGTSSRLVVAALPTFSVFSSIISMPEMSKKELGQAIAWEAKKFVPLPLEDMMLDWQLLAGGLTPNRAKESRQTNLAGKANLPVSDLTTEEHKKNDNSKVENDAPAAVFSDKSVQKKQRILITAAPRSLVSRYLEIFKIAGLEILALETEGFALERSLVGHDKSVIMIVDIGAFTTSISIVEDGIPVLSRSVDVGGETVTQIIAKSLNVDERRAEQFKRDIGFSDQTTGNTPKTIENTINPVINEIKYSFDLYAGSYRDAIIEKIILTGGSSLLPGLVEYLKKILHINVFIGDPWARVIYPTELTPVLQQIGPRFAVALGLAMREIV